MTFLCTQSHLLIAAPTVLVQLIATQLFIVSVEDGSIVKSVFPVFLVRDLVLLYASYSCEKRALHTAHIFISTIFQNKNLTVLLEGQKQAIFICTRSKYQVLFKNKAVAKLCSSNPLQASRQLASESPSQISHRSNANQVLNQLNKDL